MTTDHLEKNSLKIGELTGVFGLQGWLKVISWSDPRENIFNYKTWQLISSKTKEYLSVEIEQGKLHRGGKVLIVKLQGIDDISQAETLIGNQIHINKNLLQFKDNKFYWFELLGMQVVNCQQQFLGKVDSLLETGKHDVLKIRLGENSYLIPYLWDKVIKTIDRDRGLIVVDWPVEWLDE